MQSIHNTFLLNNIWFSQKQLVYKWREDFPGGPVVKNLPSNAGDAISIPGLGTKIPLALARPKDKRSPCSIFPFIEQ